jgi:hypothetical protein
VAGGIITPPGAHHRLGEEGGDRVWVLAQDDRLQLLGQRVA